MVKKTGAKKQRVEKDAEVAEKTEKKGKAQVAAPDPTLVAEKRVTSEYTGNPHHSLDFQGCV